jgi:hypothetical protein
MSHVTEMCPYGLTSHTIRSEERKRVMKTKTIAIVATIAIMGVATAAIVCHGYASGAIRTHACTQGYHPRQVDMAAAPCEIYEYVGGGEYVKDGVRLTCPEIDVCRQSKDGGSWLVVYRHDPLTSGERAVLYLPHVSEDEARATEADDAAVRAIRERLKDEPDVASMAMAGIWYVAGSLAMVIATAIAICAIVMVGLVLYAIGS